MCASKYKACIVVNFCFPVWQQRSNIFAPPDGELTCVVCEANRAASLAEPASKPLATICDDTRRCNHRHGPGTEEADKTEHPPKLVLSPQMCPAYQSSIYRMEIERAFGVASVPGEDFWLGLAETTEVTV